MSSVMSANTLICINHFRTYLESKFNELLNTKDDVQFFLSQNKIAKTHQDGYRLIILKKQFIYKSVENSNINDFNSACVLYWYIFSKKKMNHFVAYDVFEIILDDLIKKIDNLYIFVEYFRFSDMNHLDKNEYIRYLLELFFNQDKLVNRYKRKIFDHNRSLNYIPVVEISAQLYEREPLIGELYLLDNETINGLKENDNKRNKILFYNETGIYLETSQLRLIRKLLEMAKNEAKLVINISNHEIIGLMTEELIDSQLHHSKRYCYSFEFKGHLNWNLKKVYPKNILENNENENTIILIYDNGTYKIPILERSNEELAEVSFSQMKHQLSNTQVADIREITKKIKQQQSHGTAIIFLKDNTGKNIEENEEVIRLCSKNRGYRIEPTPLLQLDHSMIQGITAIDGALIIDFDGNLLAAGVIVDGKVVVKGDNGRGSRYNSIANYINWIYQIYKTNIECFALILSEDGMENYVICEKYLQS